MAEKVAAAHSPTQQPVSTQSRMKNQRLLLIRAVIDDGMGKSLDLRKQGRSDQDMIRVGKKMPIRIERKDSRPSYNCDRH